MKFAAIDFETATSSRDSACAVGVSCFDFDEKTGSWLPTSDPTHILIQPPGNEFDEFNVNIHGITPVMTKNSETFDKVWPRVETVIAGRLLLAHNTSFDMFVLRDSLDYYEVTSKSFDFVCSYRLAKATWPTLFSYRLDVLANELAIPLDHHNAGSDSFAAGMLAVQICETLGVNSLEDAATSLGFRLGHFGGDEYRPFSNSIGASLRSQTRNRGSGARLSALTPSTQVDPNNPMFGLSFAFTGTLSTLTRQEAAQLVVDRGGHAHTNPTKSTSYLVVGMTDFSRVRDGMSGKMKKALQLADSGTGIEIIDESQFVRMLA